MGVPLDVTTGAFRSSHHTYVIYWGNRDGIDALQPGHAALIIDSVRFHRGSASYYVSWIGTGRSHAFGTIKDMQLALAGLKMPDPMAAFPATASAMCSITTRPGGYA